MLLYYTMFAHCAVCIWIRLGGYDIYRDPTERSTWLFISDTDFNKDPRPIYDQITDPDSDSSFASMYIYAMVFIMQTLTSVGYGNTSYGTQIEWIYVIFLETVSVGLTALAMITVVYLINLRDRAFDEIIYQYSVLC